MNNSQTNDSNPAKHQKLFNKTEESTVVPVFPAASIEKPLEEVIQQGENAVKMEVDETTTTKEVIPPAEVLKEKPPTPPVIKKIITSERGSRRGSQESAMTSTTTTSATHSSSTSSDSSSDSSDSDSSSSGDETDQENVLVDQEQITIIYKMCIKNLEECVSRFPEHYKSIYRLVHNFLHVNEDLDKCRQLLLTSSYKTTLGNSINGLFSERKSNNFFNGIWRIPTAEIDRPGNFTSHLSKCIIILMDVLKKTNDHETLLDLAMQLQKIPENEKKYLTDCDRKELYQQALACSVQAFKNKLKEIAAGIVDGKNSDRDLLSLMLEIFKSHRRTYKNVTASKDQNVFASVMVEVYKEYIKDRMKVPENANYCDLAFKMCQQEMNYRKNLEKGIVGPNPNAMSAQMQPLSLASTTSSPILNIKSVSEINKSVISSSNTQSTTPQNNSKLQSSTSAPSSRVKPRSSGKSSSSNAATSQQWLNAMMQALYSNPGVMNQTYLSEYYKMLGIPSNSFSAQQLALLSDPNFAANLLAGTSSGNASPTSSSPALSPSTVSKPIDTKLIESLMKSSYGSNSLQGLQQNLKSNSLSITTTTVTSTTTTSSSASKAQTTMSSSSRKSEVKNPVRKSHSNAPSMSSSSNKTDKTDLNSSGLSTKYSSLFGSNLNLPDLPKSLSITPSMPATSSSSTSNSAKANEKKSQKVKSSASALGKFNLNPALSITPEGYKANAAMANSKSVSNMLKSYEEFLKSYPNTHQGIVATSKKSSPVAVSGMSTSAIKQKQKSNLQIANVQHVPQKAKPSAKVPYDFGKNIASSFMPTPNVSTSPFPMHTPPLAPPSPHTSSSPKTLQQKLAERKKQHQTQQQQQQQPKSSAKKASKINYKNLNCSINN